VRLSDVPLSAAAAKAVAANPELGVRTVTGGDDYEVLAAVPSANADAFRSAAAQAGVAVTRIGRIEPHAGMRLVDAQGRRLDGDEFEGFDHFRP
jgi:thiamine-monophosphate kinase